MNRTEISKFLSYVLRHEPESIGLTLGRKGWADIGLLIAGAAGAGKSLSRAAIEDVVATSDKKRFALSEDGQRIRAVQGHSTASVSRNYEERVPPPVLYHGTATRFLDSIRAQGLIPGSRHHVHLSADPQTAATVGQRYGKPAVLKINALRMHQQGIKFYQAENGVWLTDTVPPQFIAE